jgi:hypothetical protein
MPRQTRVTTIAVRGDDSDKWVAVVSCMESEKIITPTDLHAGVLVAVREWVRKNKAGKEAFEESSRDFNVADLANHLDSYSLRDELLKVGIERLNINLFDDSGDFWDFDEVLVNEMELTDG